MIRTLTFFWLLTFVCCSWATAAEIHWPRFRGPNADGVAPDHRGLPLTWTTTKNVKWVADVPGWGWSCPVVWGDRVFLTSVIADQQTRVPSKGLYLGEGVRQPEQGIHRWMVYCFQVRRTDLWQRAVLARRFVHRVALRVQRAPVLSQRRRTDVRHQTGAGIRNPADQSPRRTLPRQSRHSRRQTAHSDRIQAVLLDRGCSAGRRQLRKGVKVATHSHRFSASLSQLQPGLHHPSHEGTST